MNARPDSAIARPARTWDIEARATLRTVFGYDDFRPGQAEVIQAVLAGEDVLAVMPTGSGKSMCYQLPALVEGGLTVVISPLIALMRDQVQQMKALGVAAATLNSANSEDETRAAWDGLRDRSLRLLFVSPERLSVDGLAQRLARGGITRLAVDEAHCVSQWGHDFRPDYRDISRVREALSREAGRDVPVLGLTASADRATQGDIATQLFRAEPRIFVHSFDRPNLTLRFQPKDQPRRQLATFLDRHRGEAGIVYASSRDRTEKLAAYFAEQGHEAVSYHAGLDAGVRARRQDRFLQEDGVVVVATIAFGMGINKPDVRFVAHADMPGSVEAYYQEIGRAGRDGMPADTLTLYGLDDMALRRRQIDEKDLSPERRTVEHRRLEALIGLCETPGCKRQALLAYFGETRDPCADCRVCARGSVIADATVAAQKMLSAVVRTGERFGAGHLIDVLRGEATETVRKLGHDQIRTFGVGKEHDVRDWRTILRQLFGQGAVAQASDEHGGFCLTDKGADILRGRQEVALYADPAPTARAARRRGASAPESEAASGLDSSSAALLADLKKLRLSLAREEGIAAFMIFPDRTLIALAQDRPSTLTQMSKIYGVGARKLEAYGEAFLEAISGFRG
jgi:ATP-dependent DNA helicase RecQ